MSLRLDVDSSTGALRPSGALALALLLASAWCAPAASQPEHSPIGRGKALALELCSICHVVASNQRDPPLIKQATPKFQDVADDPKTSAKSLKHFLATTHWDQNTVPMTMPNYNLTSRQINDVVAYILSLRGQPQPRRAP